MDPNHNYSDKAQESSYTVAEIMAKKMKSHKTDE
jgi:hypothetical protein